MREIKIDFDNPGLPQRLDVVENDAQSRFFKAVLYKDGKAYAAPSGATYSIMYRGFGPQNEGWYDTINDGAGKRAACIASGNVVTCELARQSLRVPGHMTVVLCVTNAKGYMLKSWPIMANVRNDDYDDTAEVEMYFNLSGIAGNYLTQLEKAMANAEKIGRDLTATAEQTKQAIDEKAKAALALIPEDYTALSESVGQVKEEIVNLNSSIGNNIIPIQHYINNKIVDGSGYHDEDGWIATENFISVDGISKLITNVTAIFYVVYDANMTVIDNGTLSVHERVVRDGYSEYHFYSNAKYIKFAIQKASLNSNYYISFNTYERINDFAIKSTSDYIDNNILKNVAWLNGYYIQGDGLHQNDGFKTSDYVYCHGQSVIKLNYLSFFVLYDNDGRTVLSNGASDKINVGNAYSVRFATEINHKLIASFGDYKNNVIDRNKVYVGENCEYTRLMEAINYAYIKGHCDIFVKSGTYDVLAELADMGIDITKQGYEGVFIGNDTNLYCETDTILICDYQNVSQASHNFSVLNCDDSNFVIENLTILAKNIRYCVHDDPNTTTRAYTHKFINCHMEIDNSENEYWKGGTCIGAGLGHKSYVVIDGGYYKGKYLNNAPQSAINYHGDSTQGTTDSKSNLFITNVYFDEFSTCGVTKYGSSEKLSEAYISNCSMYSDIIFDTEEGDTGGWILKAWNNEIRS